MTEYSVSRQEGLRALFDHYAKYYIWFPILYLVQVLALAIEFMYVLAGDQFHRPLGPEISNFLVLACGVLFFPNGFALAVALASKKFRLYAGLIALAQLGLIIYCGYGWRACLQW
jgi:hypothetical protein